METIKKEQIELIGQFMVDINFNKYKLNWSYLEKLFEKIKDLTLFAEISVKFTGTNKGCSIVVFDFNNVTLFETYPKVNSEGKTIFSESIKAVTNFIEWYNDNYRD